MPKNQGPDGKFLPGNVANPGGRPSGWQHVRAAAREHTTLAIKTLVKAARDDDDRKSQVRASEVLLDRAWGKPVADAVSKDEVLSLMAKMGEVVDKHVTDPQVRQRIANEWSASYAALVAAKGASS